MGGSRAEPSGKLTPNEFLAVLGTVGAAFGASAPRSSFEALMQRSPVAGLAAACLLGFTLAGVLVQDQAGGFANSGWGRHP